MQTDDSVLEVKQANKNWKLPLYQLRQLTRKHSVPGVVLCDSEEIPVLELAPSEVLERERYVVVKFRRVHPGQKVISFTIEKYLRLLARDDHTAVEVDLGSLGLWLLVPFRSARLMPGRDALHYRSPATTSDKPARRAEEDE